MVAMLITFSVQGSSDYAAFQLISEKNKATAL